MIQHVALIMDGNRRWAREKKLPAFAGHQKGYLQVEKIVNRAQKIGIKYITFWAFSTENWKRNEDEITYLLNLFRKVFQSNLFNKIMKKGGKICVLGDTDAFPQDIQKMISEVIENSKNNTGIQLNIALNYGGREEILHAVSKILEEYKRSPIPSISSGPEPVEGKIGMTRVIDEEMFSKYLYTKGQPDPDLIIRTGGAQRLSGYLPWQSVYSELYFVDTYWPDFGVKEFDKAIKVFERRERRFGK